MKKLIVLLFLCNSAFAFTQVEIDASAVDTTQEEERYIDYSNQLLLKVMTVVKQNTQEIVNTSNEQTLQLSPYGITSLGFGFTLGTEYISSKLSIPLAPILHPRNIDCE